MMFDMLSHVLHNLTVCSVAHPPASSVNWTAWSSAAGKLRFAFLGTLKSAKKLSMFGAMQVGSEPQSWIPLGVPPGHC
jgi:hypothetical protein